MVVTAATAAMVVVVVVLVVPMPGQLHTGRATGDYWRRRRWWWVVRGWWMVVQAAEAEAVASDGVGGDRRQLHSEVTSYC